ncbi:hypothetical protein PGB90_005178 [Kerria lacca]
MSGDYYAGPNPLLKGTLNRKIPSSFRFSQIKILLRYKFRLRFVNPVSDPTDLYFYRVLVTN